MRTDLAADQRELVAIGAAVGANCEPCLKFHIDKAHASGLTDAQMRAAVAVASQVKETPARLILDLADRLLAAGEPMPPEPAKCGCRG